MAEQIRCGDCAFCTAEGFCTSLLAAPVRACLGSEFLVTTAEARNNPRLCGRSGRCFQPRDFLADSPNVDEVLGVLREIALDAKACHGDRITAACAYLDRAKPAEPTRPPAEGNRSRE